MNELTKYKGLQYYVLPSFIKMNHVGWGNGYVILPPDHQLHGIDYYDIDNHVMVHGGLTYSQFDNNNNWVVGFDTGHFNSLPDFKTKESVIEETKRLAEQLSNIKII